MKTLLAPLCLVLFTTVTLAPVTLRAAPDPNTGVTLEVEVTLPGDKPTGDQRLVSGFVSRIQDVFQREGYTGAIVVVTGRDQPNESAVLLTIALRELDQREDNVDCVFTARLRTNADEVELGEFRDKGLTWDAGAGHPGPKDNDKKGPSSDRTIRQLYEAIARTSLVPGLSLTDSPANAAQPTS